MIEQAIKMLERMIERHKAALEELRKQGAPAAKIQHVEVGIRNYEEQLKRLREQQSAISDQRSADEG